MIEHFHPIPKQRNALEYRFKQRFSFLAAVDSADGQPQGDLGRNRQPMPFSTRGSPTRGAPPGLLHIFRRHHKALALMTLGLVV